MHAAHRTSPKVRALVADRSRIHTQLLSEILQRDSDFEVICWDCVRSNLIPTALAHDVHVVAISSTLDGSSQEAVSIVQEMHAAKPGAKIVVLLDSQDDTLVLDFLRAGARGIFPQESSLEMLRKCLHSVHKGELWIDSQGVSVVINALAALPNISKTWAKGMETLSRREREVVEWMFQGLSNREISDRMALSQHTIKNYIFHIFEKMGVSSRGELLFLILSQNNTEDGRVAARNFKASSPLDDEALSALIRDAEQGSAHAQLALAEVYAERRESPQDAQRAFKWYSILTERLAQAQSALARTMSAKELEEGQRQARTWLAEIKHASASTRESSPTRGTSLKVTRIG